MNTITHLFLLFFSKLRNCIFPFFELWNPISSLPNKWYIYQFHIFTYRVRKDMANKNYKFSAYIGVQSIHPTIFKKKKNHPTKLIQMYVLKVHPSNLFAIKILIVSITKPTNKKETKRKLLYTFSLQLIILNPKIYT